MTASALARPSAWLTRLADNPRRASLILVLLALLLRLPSLASRPIWYDEAFSVLFSSKGLAAMVEGSFGAEVHPLLYYALLSAWMRLWGDGPLAVRSLSLLTGLLTVLLGYLLALRLTSPRQALAGGILIASLPFQVHYAQEARMYSLLASLLAGTTLAFVLGIQRGGWMTWVAFGVLAGASVYAHYLAVFYLAPLALSAIFIRPRRIWLSVAGGTLLAAGLFLPWAGMFLRQWARLGAAYWIAVPGIEELVRTMLVFGAGLPLPDAVLPIALFLVLFVVVVGGIASGVAVRRRESGWERGLWLLGMASVPGLLMFLVSQWVPVYLERALLPSGVMFALWLGWSLVDRPFAPGLRRMALAGLAGLVVLGLWGFYTYRGFPYAPFEQVNQLLASELQPGEIILHSNKLTALPAAYLDSTQDLHYLSDRQGSGSSTLADQTQRVLGLIADPSAEQAVGGARGVWLIVFSRELDEYRGLGVDPHPAIAELQMDFLLASEAKLGDLIVQHYTLREGGSG